MSSATSSTSTVPADRIALGRSLERVLGQPLAALRASIESLMSELEAGDPHNGTLVGALDQVTRMARDLQSLVEFAAPRPLAPLHCSFEEIARGVVAAIGPRDRERLEIAHPGSGAGLDVDGPLLVSCLASLAQGALCSAPGDVLLQVRRAGGTTVFTLVRDDAGALYQPECVELDPTCRDASLTVQITVARRDIARMGGELCVQHTARGLTCVSVLLPSGVQGGTR